MIEALGIPVVFTISNDLPSNIYPLVGPFDPETIFPFFSQPNGLTTPRFRPLRIRYPVQEKMRNFAG